MHRSSFICSFIHLRTPHNLKMACQLRHFPHANVHRTKHSLVSTTRRVTPRQINHWNSKSVVKVKVLNGGGESYLDMWRKAMDREWKEIEFQRIADKLNDFSDNDNKVGDGGKDNEMELEKKNEEFQKLLEISKEERDRIQRVQVIDRAAAAIAAARAILKDSNASLLKNSESNASNVNNSESGGKTEDTPEGLSEAPKASIFLPRSETPAKKTPGPDFWSWSPPKNSNKDLDNVGDLQMARKSPVYPTPINPAVEKTRSMEVLPIPFESKHSEPSQNPLIPPFQSMIEVEKENVSESSPDALSLKEEQERSALFSAHAKEAVHALDMIDEVSTQGVNPNGSRWWKETGIEMRPDGVICRWTMSRGVSADHSVEWQEKFWEAADDFGYKELGSEKSGRDATGNVWREYWRESMGQNHGLVYLEKTADKWGKNGKGDEWQEKWWEHYNASGQSDKWAHKWCSIDPNTQLYAGHAHVWHERWGEKYDGRGGSIKYTDKWAERCDGDGWSKWGDKWDENFDPNGHGVKQGETWWEGKHRERWNRTWGEGHNGSGWVHKYGKSSSGEHWDTHVRQDTWYERFPHYGFYHCFDNSVQLREVRKPSEFLEPESFT